MRIAAIVLVATAGIACPAVAESPLWRYDFRPGDHLTYSYTFQRRVLTDEKEEFEVDSRVQTQVLIMGSTRYGFALGFQRNREAAELTKDTLKGKDKLDRKRPAFEKRLAARPHAYSEANEISAAGEPRAPWEMDRETRSQILESVHEVMPLPPNPVAKGATWRSSESTQLEFRWAGDEVLHNKPCHRIDAALPDGSLKISYWWSPDSGVLEQIAMDGTYSAFGTTHETLHMELVSRTRDEPLNQWLSSAETRDAALQSLLLSPELPVTADQLAQVLSSTDKSSQSLALAIASRRTITLPADAVNKLRQNPSPRLKVSLDAYDTSTSHEPFTDQCRRPIPAKLPAKFGTTLMATQVGERLVPYYVRVPLTYREDRPSPLLIYLSGGPGLANDALASGQDAIRDTNYLVLYPHAGALWWSPEITARFDAVFNDVLRLFNVDRNRIYITGFSNGGTGSIYYATLWPHRFAAVVSLMGAGQCNEQIKAGMANLGNLPLLFVHGEEDKVITPDCSTTTVDALRESGMAIKPELKILPKLGHEITFESDNGLALQFFKDKVRNPYPRDLKLVMTNAWATRNDWIEILSGTPGKATLDARIKTDNSGNAIEIHSHDVRKIRLYLRPELFPKPGELRIVWNGKTISKDPVRDACTLPIPPSGDLSLDLADTRELSLP